MAASNGRFYQEFVEVLGSTTSNARFYQEFVEVLGSTVSSGRFYQQWVDILAFASSAGRVYQEFVEVIHQASIATTELVESDLTLTQTIAVNVHYSRTVSHTLTITQAFNTPSIPRVAQTLTINQAIGLSKTLNLSVVSTLALSQTVSSTKAFGRSVTSTLALTQTIYNGQNYDLDVTSTLSLISEPQIRENVISHLVLTQTILAGHRQTRTVSHELALTQTILVNGTFNRTVAHTITFNSSRLVPTGFGTFVDVPGVSGDLVRDLVVLMTETPQTVITLPPPEFGDSLGGTSKINIKRSMAGDRRVYKRRSPTSKLSYTFVITRLKAIELRSFILNNNSKQLRMINWKAETWIVKLTNNPFSFSEDARWDSIQGNKCSITLEFEGVRLT